MEFAYRENNSGRFPRGLSAMIQALSTWLYDDDPLAPLAWEGPLADIKARLAAGEKVFENAIRDRFLNNEHRATVVLLPDARLAKAREEREAARLAAVHAACSDAERQRNWWRPPAVCRPPSPPRTAPRPWPPSPAWAWTPCPCATRPCPA